MAKLTDKEIKQKLKGLPNWQHVGKEITKKFKLKDFKEAISFVNKVADLAEAANHHPDIVINYNVVTLTLSTHSQGGVTENDFKLADEIEKAS